jgi:hypothetical protein
MLVRAGQAQPKRRNRAMLHRIFFPAFRSLDTSYTRADGDVMTGATGDNTSSACIMKSIHYD